MLLLDALFSGSADKSSLHSLVVDLLFGNSYAPLSMRICSFLFNEFVDCLRLDVKFRSSYTACALISLYFCFNSTRCLLDLGTFGLCLLVDDSRTVKSIFFLSAEFDSLI